MHSSQYARGKEGDMEHLPFWLIFAGMTAFGIAGGVGLGLLLRALSPEIRDVFSWFLVTVASGMLFLLVYENHFKDRRGELAFVSEFPYGCEGALLEIYDVTFSRRMVIAGCRVNEDAYILWDPACERVRSSVGLLGDARVVRTINSPRQADVLRYRMWEREQQSFACEN